MYIYIYIYIYTYIYIYIYVLPSRALVHPDLPPPLLRVPRRHRARQPVQLRVHLPGGGVAVPARPPSSGKGSRILCLDVEVEVSIRNRLLQALLALRLKVAIKVRDRSCRYCPAPFPRSVGSLYFNNNRLYIIYF